MARGSWGSAPAARGSWRPRARLRGIEERWTRELGGASARFSAKRRELDALRSDYQQLDAAKQRGRQELEAKRREHQLQQYLDQHFIAGSGVPGIGTGRAATLASYGIETADKTAAAVLMVVSGNTAARLLGRTPRADIASARVDLRSYFAQHPPVAEPGVSGPPPATLPRAWRACNGGGSYCAFQVEKQAATVPGTLLAAYPEMLRSTPFGNDGKVIAQFVVDPSGRADMSTWKVLATTNDLFSQSARDGVRRARFYPAEIGGRKVKQLVQVPFTFTLTR